jgi:hypothetical protein
MLGKDMPQCNEMRQIADTGRFQPLRSTHIAV